MNPKRNYYGALGYTEPQDLVGQTFTARMYFEFLLGDAALDAELLKAGAIFYRTRDLSTCNKVPLRTQI